MSETPLTLDDADFAEDAPPGYRSQQLKERYVPLMITLLVFTFLAQMVLPFVIVMASMPSMMMQTMAQRLPQHAKMTVWQNALWYPSLDGPGGGRGGCTLQALDYAGKPLDTPAIELDSQPEWLLGDGDRLWAVSKNEVAEVLADGSRPVVMHPTRYLEYAAQPFLFEGKLATVDWSANETPAVFCFENGEWVKRLELDVSQSSDPSRGSEPADLDTPADALEPQSADAELESQRSAAQAFLKSSIGEIEQIQVVRAGAEYHLVIARAGSLLHHESLPIAAEGTNAPRRWHTIDARSKVGGLNPIRTRLAELWSLTVVGGAPAIFTFSADKDMPQLWRWVDGQWQLSATGRGTGNNMQSELTAFSTPDGSRTFAVVEQFAGMSHELVELHPDRIEKIRILGDGMPFANPMSPAYMKMQIASNVSVYGPLILQVLLVTWLMNVHRDPNYYKGLTSVRFASVLRRVMAMFFDWMIVAVPVSAGWYWWYARQELTYMEMVQEFINDPLSMFLSILPGMLATMAWYLIWAFASWLMIAWGGFTVGKWLCGVRVVRINLEPPGLLKSLVRLILWAVETMMFNGIVAFVLIAFTQNRQRLADMVAGTVVLEAGSLRRARAEMAPLPQ